WVAREGVLQDVGTGPSIALELSALPPTLPGEHRLGAELVAITSARVFDWTVHLNVGPLVAPHQSEPGVVWGVIAEHPIRGGLRAGAEIDGETVRRSPADNSALLAMIWTVSAPRPLKELSFDLGLRRGLSGSSAAWGGTAGLTFAFPWETSSGGR